jgi:PQQ-dependent catabolism-associated CXXCW motif protein
MNRALRLVIVALTFASLALPAPSVAGGPSFDDVTGYRISQLRSPTPDTVPGGTRVTLEELQSLAVLGAVLLDVMPSDGAGPDPVSGAWHVPKPHSNMAGSVWLPDVGKSDLSPILGRYLSDNLIRLTAGNKSKPVVIYCQADCWMSWNAIKRAASLGYTALYWYPEGTDGMRDWDVPLVAATPVPLYPMMEAE